MRRDSITYGGLIGGTIIICYGAIANPTPGPLIGWIIAMVMGVFMVGLCR